MSLLDVFGFWIGMSRLPIQCRCTHTHTLSVSSVPHFVHVSLVFFSVRMSSPHDYTQAYLYVQFESRRRGYIDDVEFLLADGTMQLRTSSRLGYLDLGVNAKVSLDISRKNSRASIFSQCVAPANCMSARVNHHARQDVCLYHACLLSFGSVSTGWRVGSDH